jgi:hypothetical protein
LLSFGAESFVFQFTIQKYKIHRNIIFLVVLYGCGAWSLTREESRLWVYENRVFRRMFGTNRDEIT